MFDNHKKPTNLFKLLCNKTIIEILDGDTEFGELPSQGWGSSIKISMPYLSGPAICGISTRFGLAADYPRTGGAQSRWSYFEDLLKHCIDNNQAAELLAFLFSKNQFTEKLKGLSPSIIDATYKDIVEKAIENINSVLYFSGNELVVIGETFSIRTIGAQVTVVAPAVKQIDRGYIKDLGERALKDIEESNCDSAITKSRTLLEEVFCYVIEKKNEAPSSSGDIGKLYIGTRYNIHIFHRNRLMVLPEHDFTKLQTRYNIHGISSNTTMAAFLRHPNFSKRYAGLYLCGGSVHPGGGMPLATLSGVVAAQLLMGD